MVHVWIAPHECGPFAALEGHGAGQAGRPTAQRADQCAARPRRRHRPTAQPATAAYDPTQADRPVRRRRRHARAAGLRREPRRRQRSSACRSGPTRPSPRPPASTRSATARTGHEHYVQWDWIDDDVVARPGRTRRASSTSRSPTAPRSWCRRCTCCPTTSRSTTCPTTAAPLMQWHIHDNLCYTDDPVAPQVARPHRAPNGTCRPPLVKHDPGADDPRLDHAPPVRPVRRPRRASAPARSPRARSACATTPTARTRRSRMRGRCTGLASPSGAMPWPAVVIVVG